MNDISTAPKSTIREATWFLLATVAVVSVIAFGSTISFQLKAQNDIQGSGLALQVANLGLQAEIVKSQKEHLELLKQQVQKSSQPPVAPQVAPQGHVYAPNHKKDIEI